MNVFEYVPLTFEIIIPEGKVQNLDKALKKFRACYDVLDRHKHIVVDFNKMPKPS